MNKSHLSDILSKMAHEPRVRGRDQPGRKPCLCSAGGAGPAPGAGLV